MPTPDPTPTDEPTLEQDDLDRTAAAVRRFWRDWPESRRQSVRDLSSFLADAIEELCVVVAKRERDACHQPGQCQGAVYDRSLSAPERCALKAGHEGTCEP